MSQLGPHSDVWSDDNRRRTLLSLEGNHRRAVYALEYKQYEVSGWDAIEQALSAPATPASLASEITQLKKQHEAELQSIYDAHYAEYRDNAQFLYESLEPGQYDAENARKLLSKTNSTSSLQRQWDAEIEQCKTAYLRLILPLQKRIQLIHKESAGREALRLKQFPVSPEDYHSKDEDMQVLVARFLVMSNQDKEKMLDKMGWAWAQVQPLMEAFKSPDETFKEEILERAKDDKTTTTGSRRAF